MTANPGDSDEYDPHEYWERRLAPGANLSSVGNASWGTAYNRALYRVRRRVFRRTVVPALRTAGIHPSASSVLDVGSGSGFYIRLWRQLGFRRIVGLDLTEAAVRSLRRDMPDGEFYTHDISTGLPTELGDHAFDAVSAFDVLFHVTDDAAWQRAVHSLAHAVRQGGLLFLTDVFLRGPRKDMRHWVGRSRDDVVTALETAGFAVESRAPVFVTMENPVDSRSRAMHLWFRTLDRFLTRAPEWSRATVGAMLAPVDIALTRIVHEGPSIEIMVCRKST